MSGLSFIKMHGLGNDFVVLDARREPVALTAEHARSIADRRTGVGCDQVIVIEAPPPGDGEADVVMRIRNADGGEVAACGNAARCVGALVLRETRAARARIRTRAGLLSASARPDGTVAVDMGPARTGWREIPLAREADTLHLDIGRGPLRDAAAVSMGNPHAVFFVDDAEAVDLSVLGPEIEHDPLFPERTNVEAVQVLAPDRLRMRVWERGAGITRACGTGACAAVVAAVQRGLAERRADVVLDGGTLAIEWREDGHVLMSGPVALVFRGTLEPTLLS